MVNSERLSVISATVGLVAMVTLYLLPSPIDPKPYVFNCSIPRLEGSLRPNSHLQRVTRLFEGQIVGPESFAVNKDGTIYTGSADGKIWAFKKNNLRLVARTGIDHPDCGSFTLEPDCGRPKGMKVDQDGFLVVADAYKGLLRVNVTTGEIETLMPGHIGIDGKPFRFLNGLDIRSDGIIYFTDSSTKWDRRNYKFEVIEMNNLGRLIAYNPSTRAARTVLDGLYLANGISLSADESFMAIAEMSLVRIRRYYLNGPKQGETDILIDNLPGYPDNIKLNSQGHFYVGLGSVRFEGASVLGSFLDIIAPYPALKRLMTKVTPLAFYDIFLPKHSLLLEVNSQGHIMASHHDPGSKVVPAISEGFEANGQVYIGHFRIPFIGEISVDDLNMDGKV
ncbi:adipocyte plasma membrane-associated protein-like isoform X1 [Haliotis rufescens]|uniref:adipocyte plasma membrane-associated protein-like isoform X1 n=1 Tax=Haliotis rufescens TaxID=6454 RepID=UPI00201F8C8D|nr:adipocyte plasma membrane-associated protein-like isoform X1 [Haliotis rufescens]